MSVITREKKGKEFIYKRSGQPIKDRDILRHIKSLVIPPAWEKVEINDSVNAKILVSGFDSAGRKQCIYNPTFRAKQEQLKFDSILRFALALPRLRKQVDKDLARKRLDKEKVLACIVKLMDHDYFRVGNERYARQNQSYGITTLRSKHADISGNTVTFDFIGKSGKEHIKQITDKQIVRIIKQLDELPGYEIFRYQDKKNNMHDISSADVNAFIKEHMSEEFSAKDFRTWGGTLLAATELIACERHKAKRDRQKMVTRVVKNVAKKLGNTPAIARSSYIDPRIIAAYVDSSDIEKLKRTISGIRPRKYMSTDERCVLRLLQNKAG